MSDERIAITTLILLGIWTAAAYARRYFRTLPDYCVTPLVPEVRPESWPCGAKSDGIPFLCTRAEGHDGWHIAHGVGEREIHSWSSFDRHADDALALFDPAGALIDELSAQGKAIEALLAPTLAEIRALPETETSS